MNNSVFLPIKAAFLLSMKILMEHGLSEAHADAVAGVLLRGQQDECASHGLYRLLLCVHTLRAGKVQCHAEPDVSHGSTAVIRIDAKGAFSPLAFNVGRPYLVEKTRTHGIAAMVINHCCHVTALWPEVEDIAADGLAALCMVPNHSYVAPAGGTVPVLGTNPIAFAWPRPDGNPYVFDFATSAAARGEIELHRRTGRKIPGDWALDSLGQPTTDAALGLAGVMLPFGGHKGSALSTMIELLAGPLIGDRLSLQVSSKSAEAEFAPCHGELIIAFDPSIFSSGDTQRQVHMAETLFAAITGQGARLPSQRRFEARARTAERGTVEIPGQLYTDILELTPDEASKKATSGKPLA